MAERKKGLVYIKAICQWKYDSKGHSPVTINLNSEFLLLFPKCHGHMMQSTHLTKKKKKIHFVGSGLFKKYSRGDLASLQFIPD